MKTLIESVIKELKERCKACIAEERAQFPRVSVKDSALNHFYFGYECFVDLFDTDEEVLKWLEDEKMI